MPFLSSNIFNTQPVFRKISEGTTAQVASKKLRWISHRIPHPSLLRGPARISISHFRFDDILFDKKHIWSNGRRNTRHGNQSFKNKIPNCLFYWLTTEKRGKKLCSIWEKIFFSLYETENALGNEISACSTTFTREITSFFLSSNLNSLSEIISFFFF